MSRNVFPRPDYERVLRELGWAPAHLVVAERFCDRLLGMTVRPPVTADGLPLAMAFPRCASVHTCFMHYPLDVAFIDRGGDILRVCEGVAPWRFLSCAGAFATLERAALISTGSARTFGVVRSGASAAVRPVRAAQRACDAGSGRSREKIENAP